VIDTTPATPFVTKIAKTFWPTFHNDHQKTSNGTLDLRERFIEQPGDCR
jgi:hypothetical protein